jgi:hypothetical protein
MPSAAESYRDQYGGAFSHAHQHQYGGAVCDSNEHADRYPD